LVSIYANIGSYENHIKQALLNEASGMLDDTSSNVLSKIVDQNQDFVRSNLKNEELRLQNQEDLKVIKSETIHSLFVLFVLDGSFFYLLDTDTESETESGEAFIPENDNLFTKVVQDQKKRIFIQKEVEELSFTLIKPIIQDGKTVALLVIDYSENRLTGVLDKSVEIISYSLVVILALIFTLLLYLISNRYSRYSSYRDPITNTLKRNYMIDHYEKIDFKKYYAVLADIDLFKRVNNRHGENNGDKVITEIIKVMASHLSTSDKFIQYSGEEFLLLLDKELRSVKQLKILLEEIRLSVQRVNFEIADDKFNLTISMGSLIQTELEKSLQEVIHKADTALYDAKHNGRNIICYFDTSHTKRLYREKLKEMIESDKLVCYYQPIRNLENSELHHYEALLRIQDGENIIFPDKILPDLEDSYLYTHLTKKVIEYNINRLREDKKMKISVNLSADDLVNDAILLIFAQNADLSDRLLIEILENKSIDYKRVELSIQKLKLFGYEICIDDFGSGYSNLNHLLKLSIDYLKIDGSIIKEIHHDKRAYSIVKIFSTFCKQNNIEVIAEFVDKQDVVDILKSFGINYGQGWYFSKAEPYDKLDPDHK
jgi:diguanylate cyclase (GGDEF)-like protein